MPSRVALAPVGVYRSFFSRERSASNVMSHPTSARTNSRPSDVLRMKGVLTCEVKQLGKSGFDGSQFNDFQADTPCLLTPVRRWSTGRL